MVATFERAKRGIEHITGVSNVAYDRMTVLTNKLQGIAATEEYKLDAEAAGGPGVARFFARMEERDRQEIGELREILARHLQPIQQG